MRVFWVSARKPVLAASDLTTRSGSCVLTSFLIFRPCRRRWISPQLTRGRVRAETPLPSAARCGEPGQVRVADSPHLQHRGKVPGTARQVGLPS